MVNNSRTDSQKSNWKLYLYSSWKELHFHIRLSSFTNFISILKNKNRGRDSHGTVCAVARGNTLSGIRPALHVWKKLDRGVTHKPLLRPNHATNYIFENAIKSKNERAIFPEISVKIFRSTRPQNEKFEIWKAAKRTPKNNNVTQFSHFCTYPFKNSSQIHMHCINV